MPRTRLTLLVSVLTVLLLVFSPATAQPTQAAPVPCADIRFSATYTDPATGNPVTIFDDSSAKYQVPVETPLTFVVEVTRPSLVGNEIRFNSPNQFLELDEASVSDTHTIKYMAYVASPPMDPGDLRTDINWEITWPKPNDGTVTFTASIHRDDLDDPNVPGLDHTLTVGRLLTLSTKVQQGRCSAHMELNGLPPINPPGPEPPCFGLAVDIYYQATDGAFYPAIPDVQSPTNTQYDGPSLGRKVLYVITTPTGFAAYPLVHTVTFNRQEVSQYEAAPTGPAFTLAATKKKLVANPWSGEDLYVETVVKSVGLDTVTFISTTGVNGPVYNLCSTHKEVRMARDGFGPNPPAYTPYPFS